MSLISFVLIGPAGSGKTTLIENYTSKRYHLVEDYIPTIGVGLEMTKFENHTIQLWDCSGATQFWPIVKRYINNRHCVICVFDVSSYNSFQLCHELIRDAFRLKDEQAFIILVGSKTDQKRQVSQIEIDTLCQEYNLKYYTVCATNQFSIEYMFSEITKRAFPISLKRNEITLATEKTNSFCCYM